MKRAVIIRQVRAGDLEACHAIESRCYGPEGANCATIAKRIEEYPEGFLVAEHEARVVGIINSGCIVDENIAEESLKSLIGHDPNGRNLVIFSLAVHPRHRRRGIGTQLMKRYIERARERDKHSIVLLCTEALLPYYRRFSFIVKGPSASVHGGLNWFEMALPLRSKLGTARGRSSGPGV